MNQKKLFLAAITALMLTGAGCSLTHTVNVNGVALANVNVNASVKVICPQQTSSCLGYAGQTGKSGLELLQAKHTVDVSAQGFVNAIDGVKPGDHQYWSFYVNGKQADVGAKDYQTKDGDAVEWKLEAF